ncbi:hypothetical protein [uncultured phage cr61_1]|uniref:Uncharacterized protein n=1 Tax=uncultured phage cr61_1 TaxID=2986417 RepID=A0AAE7V4N8_9CAUD|nr:hypothetical protein OJM08_gp29 [uncultured phage cr61_1]QWM90613.1 hypothetical protein [uncultured phage cr61_1]
MILYKNSLPKINIKLLTLQYILDSPELINTGNLIDICIEIYNDKVIYKLLFNTKNKFDVFKLRKLAKKEDNFINCKIENSLYVISFLTPNKYTNRLAYLNTSKTYSVSKNEMDTFNMFITKTQAAQLSSLGLFFY